MELVKVQAGQIFDKFFGRDKLIGEYFREEILVTFLFTNSILKFLFKKMKLYLVKGFYNNFCTEHNRLLLLITTE